MAFSPLPILALALAAVASVPLSARAVDGALEINTPCAQAGCFSGDPPGLPVTIDGSAGRSYRLTGDLEVPDANTDAIVVTASGVTIDLNGFELRGPNACSGVPTTCALEGTGRGVRVDNVVSRTGVELRNGSVRGFGSVGVSLGAQAVVRDVRASHNRFTGIGVDVGSSIIGVTAFRNGLYGLNAGSASLASSNVVFENGGHGINCSYPPCTLRQNVVYRNGGVGIAGLAGAVVADNAVHSNFNIGILCGDGCTVSGNAAYLNAGFGVSCGAGGAVTGNTVYQNGVGGIENGDGGLVMANTVRANGGTGLALSATTPYRENSVTSNTTAAVSGGVNRGDNYCAGAGVTSALCP